MRDLIDRQKAIDTLEEPPKVPDTWSDESAIGEREQWEKDVKALNSLPSAQPEIIRCRDCKYWDQTWQSSCGPGYYYCIMIDMVTNGDFYCADAERRQDG